MRHKISVWRVLVYIWRIVISFVIIAGAINQFRIVEHVRGHCGSIVLLERTQSVLAEVLSGVCLYLSEIDTTQPLDQPEDVISGDIIRVDYESN